MAFGTGRIIRLGCNGSPRPKYGDFSGKSVDSKPVARITRLGLYGGPRGLYGGFAGKTPDAGSGPHPVDRITRLGLYGGPRQLYGSFVGKAASTPIVTPAKHEGFRQNLGRMMR